MGSLKDNMWLGGNAPGSADRTEFEKLDKAPNPNSHPNAFGWYSLVTKFTDAVRGSWSGGGAAPAGGKADGKADAGAQESKKGGKKDKKKGKKEEPKKEEEDEMDLFGEDDPEEEAKAAAALKEQVAK